MLRGRRYDCWGIANGCSVSSTLSALLTQYLTTLRLRTSSCIPTFNDVGVNAACRFRHHVVCLSAFHSLTSRKMRSHNSEFRSKNHHRGSSRNLSECAYESELQQGQKRSSPIWRSSTTTQASRTVFLLCALQDGILPLPVHSGAMVSAATAHLRVAPQAPEDERAQRVATLFAVMSPVFARLWCQHRFHTDESPCFGVAYPEVQRQLCSTHSWFTRRCSIMSFTFPPSRSTICSARLSRWRSAN